jgi:uncharacterized NAD(P)/FAD-binding protein YdhS
MLRQSAPSIAIIGGGFSGTMALYHLASHAPEGSTLLLFDKEGLFARGIAYSTRDPWHLLNVRASRMGAISGEPRHFYDWLHRYPEKWRHLAPDFLTMEVGELTYMPRMVYGAYLADLLTQAQQTAKSRQITIHLKQDAIKSLAPVTPQAGAPLHLTSQRGEMFEVSKVILAVGNIAPRSHLFDGLVPCAELVANLWHQRADSFLQHPSLAHLPADSTVAIFGTGLTMVDAVASLYYRQFPGKIIAISRHGLLPRVHRHSQEYPPFLHEGNTPLTALGLHQAIMQEIEKAELEGYDWRMVIDALRKHTNMLWQRLPLQERRRFMEDVMPWWNVHRHRMPQRSFEMMEELRLQGRLTLLPGRVMHLSRQPEGFALYMRSRSEENIRQLSANYLINATGFSYDIAQSQNPLLMQMRDEGYLRVGALRTGLETDGEYRITGRAYGSIYATGPLLFGELLESIAVPELRDQAKEAVEKLLTDLEEEQAGIPISRPWRFPHSGSGI